MQSKMENRRGASSSPPRYLWPRQSTMRSRSVNSGLISNKQSSDAPVPRHSPPHVNNKLLIRPMSTSAIDHQVSNPSIVPSSEASVEAVIGMDMARNSTSQSTSQLKYEKRTPSAPHLESVRKTPSASRNKFARMTPSPSRLEPTRNASSVSRLEPVRNTPSASRLELPKVLAQTSYQGFTQSPTLHSRHNTQISDITESNIIPESQAQLMTTPSRSKVLLPMSATYLARSVSSRSSQSRISLPQAPPPPPMHEETEPTGSVIDWIINVKLLYILKITAIVLAIFAILLLKLVFFFGRHFGVVWQAVVKLTSFVSGRQQTHHLGGENQDGQHTYRSVAFCQYRKISQEWASS